MIIQSVSNKRDASAGVVDEAMKVLPFLSRATYGAAGNNLGAAQERNREARIPYRAYPRGTSKQAGGT